jgi:glycosyltransferase involved in cell wall biosynthesis
MSSAKFVSAPGYGAAQALSKRRSSLNRAGEHPLHPPEHARAVQASRRAACGGHPGWGEALFVKDIYPQVPLLNFCEFYYHGRGADIGFDPDEETSIDDILRARARNAHLLLSLEACDAGLAPTRWQKSVHPKSLQSKIRVIFDGIDTDYMAPDPGASFTLPDGRALSRTDEIVTFAVRNLEPQRGFPNFIRALPRLLELRPNARGHPAG